ncbi:MAG TPA: DUF4397 domain-containing protein [Mucilaginibacter sp.]
MKFKLAIILFIAAVAGVASCKNNDDVFPNAPLNGRFKIVNASSNNINYFLNGTRQNNTGPLGPGGSSFYLATQLGLQNFSFKLDGSPVVLFNWPQTMRDSVNYTLYVTGTTADKAFLTTEVLVSDTAKAKLGFVNAAPNAGSLDIAVNGTLIFTAAAFKTQKDFLLIPAGSNEIKVYKAGTTTLLKDTTLSMSATNVYTLYSYGQPGATGSSRFNVGLTLNL